MDIPTVLSSIRTKLLNVPNINLIIDEVEALEQEYRRFNQKQYGWRGVITIKRNRLMGTIISLYKGQPHIVRGYPKLTYLKENWDYFKGKEVLLTTKYDGTNIGVWMLPDGQIMGKTRRVQNWNNHGYGELFEKVPHANAVYRLVRDHNVIVFGELYGTLNPGEFVKYSVPINYVVFDICSLTNFKFLDWDTVVNLCSEYGIPYVPYIKYKLPSDYKEAEMKLQPLADAVYHEKHEGEGFVIKAWVEKFGELYSCKFKATEIFRQSVLKAGGIPRKAIKEAIRKAYENIPSAHVDFDTLYVATLNELAEDFEPEFIKRARKKIAKMVGDFLTRERYISIIDPIIIEAIEMYGNDARKVLSYVGKKLKGVDAKLLYTRYKKLVQSS